MDTFLDILGTVLVYGVLGAIAFFVVALAVSVFGFSIGLVVAPILHIRQALQRK